MFSHDFLFTVPIGLLTPLSQYVILCAHNTFHFAHRIWLYCHLSQFDVEDGVSMLLGNTTISQHRDHNLDIQGREVLKSHKTTELFGVYFRAWKAVMIRQSKVTVARRDNSICEKGGLPLQTHITDRSPRLRHFCLPPHPTSFLLCESSLWLLQCLWLYLICRIEGRILAMSTLTLSESETRHKQKVLHKVNEPSSRQMVHSKRWGQCEKYIRNYDI